MRFDYYAARVEVPPPELIGQVLKLGHELRPCDGLAKAYRYQQGFQVHHHQRGVVATVFAGGNGAHPFAFASSDATDSFVDLVRGNWPEQHLPSRMDSAQDFNDSSAFKRLRRIGREVAKERGLAFPAISDELNPKAGRTQYLGSPKSDYRVRLYEKGWEQVGKLGIVAPGGLPDDFRILNESTGELVKPADWVRLEAQCRPEGEEARRLAAIASPEQAWGFTAWTHELAKRALALDLERLYIRTRKRSTDEQALHWMCGQYSNMLQRLKGDLGDWQAVGLTIGQIINEQEQGKNHG